MKIRFQVSGGYANLNARYAADTGDLPTDERDAIERAVEESGLFELDSGSVAPKEADARDVMTYTLSVSDGTRKQALVVSDITAPHSLRPLIGLLRKHAMKGGD